jgi:tRNA dimethylallyltransferase
MGPTASGKTELALALAESLPCSIVSVDSTLVYRGLDIGSAKPEPEVLQRFPHRLIDICDPSESYSAARFRDDALAALGEIRAVGRVPLLVGGTMLYFRALEQGLSPLPEADLSLRAQLRSEAEKLGWQVLHQRLAGLDPVAAGRIHPNDPQRIQRALEVIEITGRPLSELQQRRGPGLPYRLLKLARMPAARSELHRRIELRFRKMLEQGFEDEVRGLLAKGLSPALPAMRAVGYRQVVGCLQGEFGREEMIARGVAATRQLAKRQLTWLRADPQVHWLDDVQGDIPGKALHLINAFLQG